MEIRESEVLEVIGRIERGEIGVVCDRGWDVEWLPVSSETSDGWRFIVFNDGGQWDYVETIFAPDGRCLSADDTSELPRVCDYAPATQEVARRWGLSPREAWMLVRGTHPSTQRGPPPGG